MECDKVVQQRAPALRGCSAYMLRPHIFAGASVENYMVGAFRGTPGGRSDRAAGMRSRGKRLPCMLAAADGGIWRTESSSCMSMTWPG